MAPVVTPASWAISETVAPSYPLSSNTRAAASSSRSFVSEGLTPAIRPIGWKDNERPLFSQLVSVPPLVDAPFLGGASAVQAVEGSDVLVRELEVEHLGVLLDAFSVRGLADDDDALLDGPPQQHLRRCAPDAVGDLGDCAITKMTPGAEWAVGLDHDLSFGARFEEPAPVLEGTELDLVHDGSLVGDRQERVQLVDAEVRDADRAGVPLVARRLHSRPRPRRTALRPVDDVEVDVLEAEAFETLLCLGRRILVLRIELRRHVDLVAREAARPQRSAHALLVAVGLGGVDVAIAGLERPAHGVLALSSVRHLPDAESQHGDARSVREGERLLGGGHPTVLPGTSAQNFRGKPGSTAISKLSTV